MDRRDAFKYSRRFLGGTPAVFAYYNTERTKSIDIMTCSKTKYSAVDVFATLGLAEIPLTLESNGKPVRVELICVGDEGDEVCANILATAAFEVMDQKTCGWGQIIPDIIHEYDKKYDARHVILLTPAFWETYNQYETDEEIVAWLLLVPISDSEKEYVERYGVEAFEKLLAEQKTDITDRKRKSFI